MLAQATFASRVPEVRPQGFEREIPREIEHEARTVQLWSIPLWGWLTELLGRTFVLVQTFQIQARSSSLG